MALLIPPNNVSAGQSGHITHHDEIGSLLAQYMQIQATTGVTGFALQNATPTVLTWAVPNDGNLHRVMIIGAVVVTSNQTGGNINSSWTPPSGSAHNANIFTGGQTTGTYGLNSVTSQFATIGPNTTVTVTQSSAQSAGAATLWCEIWGS